jgi:hypothetical protein
MSEAIDSQPSAESESKQRRLVPQFSLNNRQETKPVQNEAPKKNGMQCCVSFYCT